jgi:flagellar motor switch protein FliM
MSTTRPSRSERRRHRGGSRVHQGQYRAFDFGRPSSLSREHVRTTQIVQETFARGLATTISSLVGSVVNVSTVGIEQHTYDEYVRELPNPTLLTLLNLSPLAGASLLQMPLPVTMCIVEMVLGGKGYQEQPARSLTELEQLLARGLIDRILPELRYALEPVVSTEPSVVGQESNPQFAQAAAPTDMMIVISFQIRIEQVTDVATLCIPFASLQPHLEALSAKTSFMGVGEETTALHRSRMSDHLTAAPVQLTAQFRPMLMASRDVVSLAVGDIVPLSHSVSETQLLTVEGVPTLTVRIGRRNRRAAVQVVGSIDASDAMQRPVRWSPVTDPR